MVLIRAQRDGGLPPVEDDRLVLQAETPWVVEGTALEVDAVARTLPPRVAARVGPAVLLTFGNCVGRFEIPGLGVVDVRSGKWDEGHFEAMLADVCAKVAGLPFRAGSGAALPYDRSFADLEPPLYHSFVYLRHALSDRAPLGHRLLHALEAILRNPHRRFERARRRVPLEAARRIDERTLIGMVEARGGWVRDAAVPPRLPALDGRLPLELDVPRARASVDVPENRFVLAFLEQCLAIVDRVSAKAHSSSTPFHLKLRADCERMARALAPARAHPLWSEVGRQDRFPAASTVLQQRRGYREVLRHFVRLRMSSRVPLTSDGVRDLLEAKDIALLYELWCFFRVVDAVTERLGPPRNADGPVAGELEVSLPHDLRVSWDAGVEVFYNPRFHRTMAEPRRSYSLPLRPDVGLWIPEGPRRGFHVLDAKFRRDLKEEWADAAARAKPSDVHKMHAYRDALPSVRSAWILYPGEVYHHYPAFGEGLDGVGAVPLLPAWGPSDHLRRVVGRLTARGDG